MKARFFFYNHVHINRILLLKCQVISGSNLFEKVHCCLVGINGILL